MTRGRRTKIDSDPNEDRLVRFFRTAVPDTAVKGAWGVCKKRSNSYLGPFDTAPICVYTVQTTGAKPLGSSQQSKRYTYGRYQTVCVIDIRFVSCTLSGTGKTDNFVYDKERKGHKGYCIYTHTHTDGLKYTLTRARINIYT